MPTDFSQHFGHMDEATKYAVCDECSTGLTNDDWTFIDFHHVDRTEAEDDYRVRMAMVAIMGNVTLTDETIPGYSQCWVCDADAIDCHIWERAQ